MDREFRRLLLALALTCLLGWWFKAHCLPGGWTGAEQYTSGCYSDAISFWTARGLVGGEIPYFEARMEYPVLTGMLIWFDAGIARLLFGSAANAPAFLGVSTLVNALLAALVLWWFWRGGMRGLRIWAWAVAPTLVLYVGHNWDLLAVVFAVQALLLARANRLAESGAAGGLGLAAKLYPVLLLPLLGLQALFGDGGWAERLRRAALVTAASVGAWAVVNLPVALAAPENWSEFYRFSSERQGTMAASWQTLATLGWDTDTPTRNLYGALLFLLGAAAIVGLGWRRHRARLWVLFTPVLAWFMLTNKVYSPQFDLWLYPMLLMTAPRLIPVALFVAAGIAAYFAEFWFFAGMSGAWPYALPSDIAVASGVRAAAMLWLIADAVRLEAPEWLGVGASLHPGEGRGPVSSEA